MTDKALASIILFCIVICLMRNYILMNELFPAAAAVCGICSVYHTSAPVYSFVRNNG